MKMKNKMKKIAALLAALAIASGSVFALASCKGDDTPEESSTPDSTPVETPAETPAETPVEGEGEENISNIPDFDFMAEDLTKYVTLGQYKDLDIEIIAKPEITDELVRTQINTDLIATKLCNEVTDRAVTENDTVYISYKGLLDGEEFEGGTGTKDFFTIYDGGGFIEGFAEGLIGAMPGVEVAVELNFPEDYYEDLAGKPVTFMVTVGHIYEAKELTDELAAEFTGNDDATVESLMASYRELLEENMTSTYDTYKLDLVWSRIFEGATEIELPAELIKSYYDIDVEYYSSYAAMYGMTYEAILEMVGMTDDDVYNRAHDNVLTDMVVYSVLKEENISINDEEYEELLDELAESSGYAKEDILKIYSKEDLNEMFIYTKVYESAVEWQNFIIVEAEEN